MYDIKKKRCKVERITYLHPVLKISRKDLREFPRSARSLRKLSCFSKNKFTLFQNLNKILNLCLKSISLNNEGGKEKRSFRVKWLLISFQI